MRRILDHRVVRLIQPQISSIDDLKAPRDDPDVSCLSNTFQPFCLSSEGKVSDFSTLSGSKIRSIPSSRGSMAAGSFVLGSQVGCQVAPQGARPGELLHTLLAVSASDHWSWLSSTWCARHVA